MNLMRDTEALKLTVPRGARALCGGRSALLRISLFPFTVIRRGGGKVFTSPFLKTRRLRRGSTGPGVHTSELLIKVPIPVLPLSLPESYFIF